MAARPEQVNPREAFGEIDIYLFDQVLKGRFDRDGRLLDAGCGSGRNLVYFLRGGLDVYGVDRESEKIAQVRELATALSPGLPADHFQVGDVAQLPYADGWFDWVICNALLHFAKDLTHFERMLDSMWRVLGKNGLFFSRLASTIGMENQVAVIGDRRFVLPDGSERFLVDEAMLMGATERLGGALVDPLKTTVVRNKRSMTTWCLRKNA